MTAATRERMRHAVAVHASITPRLDAPLPERPSIDRILGGEWHETSLGPVFARDEWYPLDHEHGRLSLNAVLDVPAAPLARLLGADEAPHPSRLAYFDIETTGLSGGTGTYVVLACLGTFEAYGFRTRQYFLADVAGEEAMLAMLVADLARFDGLVTYNGRSFDVPVVETRLTMMRLRPPWAGWPHFDLLHPMRRLYRHRMPGCRLADAERRLLHIDRPDDVPGWLVPSLYLDYLRAGRASPLRGVFRHNADDVLSLVGVLARLARLLDGERLDPEDAVAVARWWERAGEPRRAMTLYREALPWLEGGDDWAWAAGRYAALCRRQGMRDEAVSLWEALHGAGDRGAGVQLAIHLEHHARDPLAARSLTHALLDGAPPPERAALEHRLARLTRKVAATGYAAGLQ
jgi:uncharacterized protein YprB with RNaseH-like and TPR domain